MTLREAAQQALEAMEYTGMDVGKFNRINAACESLRAALETQPTPDWWRSGLAATLMREGINKHRAKEIADGYWDAYCEIDEGGTK